MIALDTNVLVRFLVEDDPEQTRRARRLVEKASGEEESLFLCDVVLCELVWVLRGAYEFSKDQVVDTLTQLLAARQLAFESPERLLRAVASYKAGASDFADYVIREHGRDHGCAAIVTFDKKLLREPQFSAP